MIGLFFTNEDVVNYDTAKTSDLEFFASYYREMANQGIYFRHLNLKGYSYPLHIVMKILKKPLQRQNRLSPN